MHRRSTLRLRGGACIRKVGTACGCSLIQAITPTSGLVTTPIRQHEMSGYQAKIFHV